VSARWIAAAALFHVTIAILLFTAGRMQLAPHLVNRDGLVPGSDSITYQSDAIRHDAAAPFHVRLLAVVFAFLAPLLGYNILAAEPLNLVCYLAVVCLTFAIGREIGGARAGFVSAAMIALWPTFVFHTLQLLKDPLFIAGALLLVFIVLTWLTQTYDWRRAAGAGLVMIVAASLVLLIRSKFAVVVLGLILAGAALLIVRQLIEKRLLVWNLVCVLAALTATALAMSASTRTFERVKAFPSPYRGESKLAAGNQMRVPTRLVRHSATSDGVSQRLGSIRDRYIAADRLAGSGVDDDVNIRNTGELIAYLPRAAAIGLWAPFPAMWLQSGRMAGTTGRLLAGAETSVIYLLEILTIAAVVLRPRRLPALLLLLFAVSGVTMLGLVVTNVGTLYRFRYTFWILLIVTGVSGAEKLLQSAAARRNAAAAALACATLLIGSCAHPAADALTITNLTGAKINALYLSPAGASTWEENILGRDILRDGDTVTIRFDSRADPQFWDLRADSGTHRAEWLRLDRNRISAIALHLDKGVAVAEVR
jgi:hypothetical protein